MFTQQYGTGDDPREDNCNFMLSPFYYCRCGLQQCQPHQQQNRVQLCHSLTLDTECTHIRF